jgi:V8-like Glu-specific endopeptidase
MSHVTGVVLDVSPAQTLGPDFGPATNPPDTWTLNFAYTPAPVDGTKLIMLHFTGASFPGNNRLEVDLGYGAGEMDVFNAADGTDFWTRPINIYNTGATITIRYIRNGGAGGGVQLDKYGRGERHTKDPDNPQAVFDSYSNCDPFLDPANTDYLEPQYATAWFCNGSPPDWENIDCVKPPGDIRNTVAPSVGMIVHVDFSTALGFFLSTCSVTLIDADTVVTAGHCMQDPTEDAESGSVIFGYQVNCQNGKRPANYKPQVCKVKEVIAQRFADGTSHDYCVIKLKTAPVGITPTPMRMDLPAPGEQVFGIHHPNGAVKKLSIPHPGFTNVIARTADGITVDLDVSGGSSGSGLFDTAGRIVGVLSAGGMCSLSYYPTASIQQNLASPPVLTRDVMIVFDRSGSMGLPGTSGQPKIQEAQAAASLFVQLVKAGTGNRVGLVSFSTTPNLDFMLSDVTPANKDLLIGPAPFTSGFVGGLHASGSTTIGGGLNTAYGQLMAGTETRHILLLTVGMQNMPPMANPADSTPAGIVIDVIGYGTPASLDGTFLTALATNHLGMHNEHGQYVLADTDLKLKKFFALAFGNIFETVLLDPEFILAAGQDNAPPLPFNVCEEETITVVVGWDQRATQLEIALTTPLGARVDAGSAGVTASSSHTWTFLRVPLPRGGERDGTWNVNVFRRDQRGEIAARSPEVRYFVNVVASGGAALRRMPDRRTYYTGDVINPLVGLQYLASGLPPNAEVKLTVTRPDTSVGTVLSRERLGAPVVVGADTIPPRQATLAAIEGRTNKAVVGYTQHSFDLFDDIASTGYPEPAGVFGNPLKDLLTVEGNYTFHFEATYGEGCTATRELRWSLHVDVGIDPGASTVTTSLAGGKGTITFIPRDRYGNQVGPGLAGGLSVGGAPGTVVTGHVRDNGDGSYTVPIAWDAASGASPGLVINQPGRAPVSVSDPTVGAKDGGRVWRWLFWIVLVIALLLFLRWIL